MARFRQKKFNARVKWNMFKHFALESHCVGVEQSDKTRPNRLTVDRTHKNSYSIVTCECVVAAESSFRYFWHQRPLLVQSVCRLCSLIYPNLFVENAVFVDSFAFVLCRSRAMTSHTDKIEMNLINIKCQTEKMIRISSTMHSAKDTPLFGRR